MSGEATCAGCLYFRRSGPQQVFKEADGRCCRYAPTGPAIQDGSGWTAFPPMFSHLWCGDHRPLPVQSDAKALAA